MAAVAAQDDRRGPAAVDHEDRLVAARRCRARPARSPVPVTAGRGCPPRAPSRRSTTSTVGAAPTGRVGSATRSYSPARARPTLSTAGVAEPSTTAAPARLAKRRSPRRAPGAGASGRSCRPPRAPRRRRPARRRRAARGPPAASRPRCRRRPARMRRHSSARSPSPRPEWTSATRASRSARSRSTSGSASAISGTRTRAGRPASSETAMAST